jgi:MinD-like ATPase involved in chromosome partitioning or flagellar assembly
MTGLGEQWRIALGALRANWFRAVLTALGVVIGVAALVAVTAVSAGAQAEVARSIRNLGGNVVNVDGEFITIGTRQSATDRTITPEDVTAIVGRSPDVSVPSDREIPKSLTEGLPIVLAAERSEAARAFRGLAERYFDAASRNGTPPVSDPEPDPASDGHARRGVRRFLRRH